MTKTLIDAQGESSNIPLRMVVCCIQCHDYLLTAESDSYGKSEKSSCTPRTPLSSLKVDIGDVPLLKSETILAYSTHFRTNITETAKSSYAVFTMLLMCSDIRLILIPAFLPLAGPFTHRITIISFTMIALSSCWPARAPSCSTASTSERVNAC